MNVTDYSETVLDHFRNPRNVGEITDADGTGELASSVCGDLIRVFIKVDSGTITDIKFQTFGCAAAVAAGSMLTEMVKGTRIADAGQVTKEAVAAALGGLSEQKMHCSNLAADALREAINDYERHGKNG